MWYGSDSATTPRSTPIGQRRLTNNSAAIAARSATPHTSRLRSTSRSAASITIAATSDRANDAAASSRSATGGRSAIIVHTGSSTQSSLAREILLGHQIREPSDIVNAGTTIDRTSKV